MGEFTPLEKNKSKVLAMNVMTRLLSSPKKARCTCKAGANGYCKLAGALLYAILEFSESGLGQIPPNETLLAQKGLSSGINQPNEPQTFQFFSKIY